MSASVGFAARIWSRTLASVTPAQAPEPAPVDAVTYLPGAVAFATGIAAPPFVAAPSGATVVPVDPAAPVAAASPGPPSAGFEPPAAPEIESPAAGEPELPQPANSDKAAANGEAKESREPKNI